MWLIVFPGLNTCVVIVDASVDGVMGKITWLRFVVVGNDGFDPNVYYLLIDARESNDSYRSLTSTTMERFERFFSLITFCFYFGGACWNVQLNADRPFNRALHYEALF